MYNVCFPLKKIRIRKIDEKKPWLTDVSFLAKVKEKNDLYALKLKTDGLSPSDMGRLRGLTAEVNTLRRELKRSFFAEKLSEAGKNSRAAWRILHDFIGKSSGKGSTCRTFLRNGTAVTGDSAIAESFCDFFTGIGPALASKVRAPPGGSYASYLGDSPRVSAAFWLTTPEEVESLCRDLDVSKGPGHDGFSPSVLRWISKEISAPLSGLINACLEVGFFPDFLKVARITPVFKSGDPTQFGNYRPISVLSVISKIFERVIQGRLLGFLKKQGHILSSQYGFRRGHSTYMAILDMVENIHKAWEKGEHCLGIFIDFKKAFDTVDHSILLRKLYRLGIRGAPFELIRSYFSNRKQYVVFNGAESSQQENSWCPTRQHTGASFLFTLYQ